MRQEQTRTLFCDKDGVSWDFERWPYKRISTAKQKTIELYSKIGKYAINNLIDRKVVYVSFGTVKQTTDYRDDDYTEQERMDFTEFCQRVEEGRY
jgi:hypothetical protein